MLGAAEDFARILAAVRFDRPRRHFSATSQTGSVRSGPRGMRSQPSNVYADHIDTPRVVTRNSDEAVLWRWDTAEAFWRHATKRRSFEPWASSDTTSACQGRPMTPRPPRSTTWTETIDLQLGVTCSQIQSALRRGSTRTHMWVATR